MAKSKKLTHTITIPKSHGVEQTPPKYPKTPHTPRTPADEAIDFFESGFKQGDEPIRVYELPLDPDGGPNKDRQVCAVFASDDFRTRCDASMSLGWTRLVYFESSIVTTC